MSSTSVLEPHRAAQHTNGRWQNPQTNTGLLDEVQVPSEYVPWNEVEEALQLLSAESVAAGEEVESLQSVSPASEHGAIDSEPVVAATQPAQVASQSVEVPATIEPEPAEPNEALEAECLPPAGEADAVQPVEEPTTIETELVAAALEAEASHSIEDQATVEPNEALEAEPVAAAPEADAAKSIERPPLAGVEPTEGVEAVEADPEAAASQSVEDFATVEPPEAPGAEAAKSIEEPAVAGVELAEAVAPVAADPEAVASQSVEDLATVEPPEVPGAEAAQSIEEPALAGEEPAEALALDPVTAAPEAAVSQSVEDFARVEPPKAPDAEPVATAPEAAATAPVAAAPEAVASQSDEGFATLESPAAVTNEPLEADREAVEDDATTIEPELVAAELSEVLQAEPVPTAPEAARAEPALSLSIATSRPTASRTKERTPPASPQPQPPTPQLAIPRVPAPDLPVPLPRPELPAVYATPARKTGLPGWVITMVGAIVATLVVASIVQKSSSEPAAKAAPPIALTKRPVSAKLKLQPKPSPEPPRDQPETPAAEPANPAVPEAAPPAPSILPVATNEYPYARYVQVAGLKIVEQNNRPQVQYLVVNNAEMELDNIALKIAVRSSKADQGAAPLFIVSAWVPKLAPHQSKEIRTDLDTGLHASQIPQPANLRTEVRVTSQQ